MLEPTVNLWLVLPAVAEAMDEQGLSREKAFAELLRMLGPASNSPRVREALHRLRAADDDLSFRAMLGEECLWAMEDSE